jgi:ribose transport system ATP-binding protein
MTVTPRATTASPEVRPRESALRISHVDKHFPGVHALKDVTFDAQAGEVHAIVGENGAGKSTLMGVTAGVLASDSGQIEIGGVLLDSADPEKARDLGLAIVYQEPALVPDLTVVENLLLGLPSRLSQSIEDPSAWAAALLEEWRPSDRLGARDYVRDLAPDARFIVEIARALAEEPQVLVLDEPTEHLSSNDVEKLFARIAALRDSGGTVVYISHRIREVRQIADRVTILRDGAVQSTDFASNISEGEIIDRIVGRQLEARFPPKSIVTRSTRLVATGLSGAKLDSIDLDLAGGQITGLAGVEGQGQSELLRAMAGLLVAEGHLRVDGREVPLGSSTAVHGAGIAYVPQDRRFEGVFGCLSLRENVTAGGLGAFSFSGVVKGAAERRGAERQRREFSIKASGVETRVDTLSGGNQQKVVLARALLSTPSVLLADEPTQGVDVGARAEIYNILRATADGGSSVVVASSDTAELVGLCDRILVLSRGKVVAELVGLDVTEGAVTSAALGSSAASRDHGQRRRRSRLGRLAAEDRAPSGVLLAVILILGLWATLVDSSYLSSANLSSVLTLFAGLGLIALGQQMVMMTSGIDLSVGPLCGFLVVLGSFVLSDELTALGLALGAVLVLVAAMSVGVLNWSLVWHLRISPMIATLVSYMALQGGSLLLRPKPGGSISSELAAAANRTIGPVPLAAVVALAIGLLLEMSLRRRWGWHLRSVGSDAESARRSGVVESRVLLGAYAGCALLTAAGAVMLMAQVGSGDANAGSGQTFASIAAVVLGGASIFGGRGSFVGALAGALLVVQINTVALFVGFSDAWQLYLLGGLTLAAAGFYSRARRAPR